MAFKKLLELVKTILIENKTEPFRASKSLGLDN